MLSANFYTKNSATRAICSSVSASTVDRRSVGGNSGVPDTSVSKLLNRPTAAAYLGVQPQTLAVWACTQRYPLPFVKIGRRVMYRLADLDAFVMANRHSNEAVMGGANG